MKLTSHPALSTGHRPPAPGGLLSFDFHPATHLVFGPGTLARLGELTREQGGNRAMVVTDPGILAAGHPERALESLRAVGVQPFLFHGVEENPSSRHVQQGVDFARRHQIDCFIAVGGGSSMDCAKGVNFLLTNGGKMSDYKGYGRALRPMLPSLGVPTTAGTGSEAQSYALIADEKTHLKMACGDRKAAFRVAILDPELTLSQPAAVTAMTGLDALTHAVESYVCTKGTDLSRLFSREAWRLLEANFETVLTQPGNLAARGHMQFGAHLAGLAIENAMLGAAHACANPLTAHYGITHGIAVGVLLPHVIRFNAPVVGGLYADLAHEAGMSNGAPLVAAESLAQRVSRLLDRARLPQSLSACGVSSTILPLLAEEASHQWTGKYNPRPVGEAELLSLYQAAF